MDRSNKRRRTSAASSAEAAAAAAAFRKNAEKNAILAEYRNRPLLRTRANLTDCRFQGVGRGSGRRDGACAGRICCPTGTAAAGKCRRTPGECQIAGIHPSQITVRKRSLTRFEVAAIRDGVLGQQDVSEHVWTSAQIEAVRRGDLNVLFPRVYSAWVQRYANEAVDADHTKRKLERRAAVSLARDSLEMINRQKKVRIERRMDADMPISKILSRRLSR
jgi:hypothetical protein